jgi:hypothetical protein
MSKSLQEKPSKTQKSTYRQYGKIVTLRGFDPRRDRQELMKKPP